MPGSLEAMFTVFMVGGCERELVTGIAGKAEAQLQAFSTEPAQPCLIGIGRSRM